MNKKRDTYKDIARLAKVSISTVSRYFRRGYVSEQTKKKIRDVVELLNYYPNHGATLIRGKDPSVFVIMPAWNQNPYASIVNGIVSASKLHDKRVNVIYTSEGTNEYIETIKYILSWNATSIVIFTPNNDQKLFEFLRTIEEDVSIVIYEHQVHGLNWIKIDETSAFNTLTKEFNKHIHDSHKKILFLNDAKLNETQTNDRYSGFLLACREANIEHQFYTTTFKNAKFVNDFITYTRKNNISNIVCSTHEAYISLAVLGDTNLRLTDIGYQSIYDRIRNYKAKVFIDYPAIGVEIETMLRNHEIKKTPINKLIKVKIL